MGYQLVELPSMANLVSKDQTFETSVVILTFICETLQETFKDHQIEINVIKAEYHGAYATIGVNYLKPDETVDLSDKIIIQGEKILRNMKLIDMVNLLTSNSLKVSENMHLFK